MNFYELTYLISPDLSEEEVKNFQEKINFSIQEKGGILDKTSKVIKRKLGYPIKEKSVAFLKTLSFYLNPEKLENLEKKLKGEKSMLRYMILTKPHTKEVLVRDKRGVTKPIIKAKPKVKVELKEIEKKLEEILEE